MSEINKMNENKLDFLLNKANIGNYNKCEIIEIFGFKKKEKEAFNIYTLIVFENTKQIPIKGLMTEKFQKFKGFKNLSWGIQKRIVDISIVKKLYSEILEKNKFCIDKPLNIGTINLLPEQYVPPREDMHHEIQLNYLLKNNFKNGSYILEFFDEDKEDVNFLLDNPILLNNFSETVSKILPLKLANVSDRLGNIIFQFPINSFELSHDSIRQEEPPQYKGISLEIYSKSEGFDIKNLQVRLFEENDNLITRQRLIDITKNITQINFDDCYGTYIELIDKKSSLLLYKYKFYIMKQMNLNMGFIEPQKRVFKINENVKKIEVTHNTSNNIHGKSKDKPFDDWIRERKYEQELKELEKSKAFIQYFGNEKKYIITEKLKWLILSKKYNLKDYQFYLYQSRLISSAITKATKDLRELINKYGKKGVYLWDPYLSAKDIKNTLYYSKATYVPLKAISGLKQNSKEEAKREMIEEFSEDNKQFLFLNLEVRGKIGSSGYDFHDRFLIFPQEKPKVWSLGISVNQLGASHHILQEVKNAQHILNAFNKLWDELNNEECLIWKSN